MNILIKIGEAQTLFQYDCTKSMFKLKSIIISELFSRKRRIGIILTSIFLISGITLQIAAQNLNAELTIEIIRKGSHNDPAAWVQIQTETNDNLGGWYGGNGPKGFPAFSPIKIKVPVGIVTITAWNSSCDEVSTKIMITNDNPVECKLTLVPRFDRHKSGYFSFDSHNHMDWERKRD